jgi:hypothetical protein
VSTGSIVLIDAPGADYNTLVKVGAVAYFLPDRTVRVYAGSYRPGTFPLQFFRPNPCQFDYVIGEATPADDFSLIYTNQTLHLNVYKHSAPRCVLY